MDGAGGAWAVKGAGFAAKPARPFKADGFKRAMAWAVDDAKPVAVPAGGGGVHAARPVAARQSVAASQAAAAVGAGAAGDAAAFCARIARAETGATRAGEGYGARNAASGALGRYQLTPQALRDLGWKDAGGGWTALAARRGVGSDADFLSLMY